MSFGLDIDSFRRWNLGLYKYEGRIFWDGPNASGTCSPVACLGDRLNGMPGPECQCADGYAGEPHYKPPEPHIYSYTGYTYASFSSGTCEPAECKIPNSIGRGIHCMCAYASVGKISWQGAVAHGECKPAPCDIPNSNQKPGPDCKCLYGYEGVVYKSSWENEMEGYCSALPCYGKFSNQKSGPDCACADGYNGTVVQRSQVNGYYDEEYLAAEKCLPAACDVDGSTGDGLECRCRDGFQGQIMWEGPRATGSCRPAPCSVANSNHEKGADCKCLDGYDGSNLDFHVVAATSFLSDAMLDHTCCSRQSGK